MSHHYGNGLHQPNVGYKKTADSDVRVIETVDNQVRAARLATHEVLLWLLC